MGGDRYLIVPVSQKGLSTLHLSLPKSSLSFLEAEASGGPWLSGVPGAPGQPRLLPLGSPDSPPAPAGHRPRPSALATTAMPGRSLRKPTAGSATHLV